ncbi:hypothetical protein HN358_02955 [Candidatus Uhrbacteria bacterium]|nr:hypothetical protein [Candidatus Uhrbacteria bacterium]MBT7717160.1 hypothetical protein [Candidatus Uhrbacteria bacterium]
MQISQHYPPYEQKTYVVVTNNELARVYVAKEREIEEVKGFKAKEVDKEGTNSGTSHDGPRDFDEDKRNVRQAMYKSLSKYLLKELKAEDADLVLCAPEALKNEVFESMHTDVQKAAEEVVPKNLASLELDQIVRILQEVR